MRDYNLNYEKLVAIARTYYYIKGRFSTKEMYSFLLEHNFGFTKPMTSRSIGKALGKSSLFKKTRKNNVSYYEVIR